MTSIGVLMFGGPKCGQLIPVPEGSASYVVYAYEHEWFPSVIDPPGELRPLRTITYRIEPVLVEWRPCNVVLWVGWIYEKPTHREIVSRVTPEDLDVLAYMQQRGGPG